VVKVVRTKVNIVLFEDYVWDLNETGIKFDDKLEIDKLGWEPGDYFKLVLVEGQLRLVKIDDLEKFIIKGKNHETDD
jgi:hypothetical protein